MEAVRLDSGKNPQLVNCKHCGIEFITSPRNMGRADIGCLFGCRESHRKQQSAQRVKAYYGTAIGRRKKSTANRSCYLKHKSGIPLPKKELEDEDQISNLPDLSLSVWHYIRFTISITDGINVSLQTAKRIVTERFRQHSIALGSRSSYLHYRTRDGPYDDLTE
jgi:hypothetical protein